MSISRRTLVGAVLAAPIGVQAASWASLGARVGENIATPVIELRQYTLFGDKRDTLISLFERAFIDPQEAAGARVIGQFRDLDDPDRFVWLRGFADMEARRAALTRFYEGPAWQANRSAANATMIDSDNVLLLRMAAGSLAKPRPPGREAVVRISIHYLERANPAAMLAFFETTMRPMIVEAGGDVQAVLVTVDEPNNFPRLPVREDEAALIWVSGFSSAAAERSFSRRLNVGRGWRDKAPDDVLPALMRKPEVLRLSPTALSKLR